MTTKVKRKKINTYVFVDTNIFLDFYRANNDASLTLLEKLSLAKDKIISTYQVEMEFLKNRQSTLISTFHGIQPNLLGSVPAVAIDKRTGNPLDTLRISTKEQIGKLKKKFSSVIEDPGTHDRVFWVLSEIFATEGRFVLTRKMAERHQIKRLALKRFLLGYPPRKQNDTSYGDAINWEWIIHVAKRVSGRIIIVSRDGDFGCEFGDRVHLNDQLKKEFRDRVGKKQILYTRKLSEALKALEIQVSKTEVIAEEDLEVQSEKLPHPVSATYPPLPALEAMQRLGAQMSEYRAFLGNLNEINSVGRIWAELLSKNNIGGITKTIQDSIASAFSSAKVVGNVEIPSPSVSTAEKKS